MAEIYSNKKSSSQDELKSIFDSLGSNDLPDLYTETNPESSLELNPLSLAERKIKILKILKDEYNIDSLNTQKLILSAEDDESLDFLFNHITTNDYLNVKFRKGLELFKANYENSVKDKNSLTFEGHKLFEASKRYKKFRYFKDAINYVKTSIRKIYVKLHNYRVQKVRIREAKQKDDWVMSLWENGKKSRKSLTIDALDSSQDSLLKSMHNLGLN